MQFYVNIYYIGVIKASGIIYSIKIILYSGILLLDSLNGPKKCKFIIIIDYNPRGIKFIISLIPQIKILFKL